MSFVNTPNFSVGLAGKPASGSSELGLCGGALGCPGSLDGVAVGLADGTADVSALGDASGPRDGDGWVVGFGVALESDDAGLAVGSGVGDADGSGAGAFAVMVREHVSLPPALVAVRVTV